MRTIPIAAITMLAMLSGCSGTHVTKLAKCTGPYRYANTYGTVLPSLPVPGQRASAKPATVSAPAEPSDGSATPATLPSAMTPPPVPSPPGKTGALRPLYPSC